MKIGVIGINHLVAGVGLREQLASICRKELSFSLETVVLTTCNRTEIYFSSDDLAETHSILLGLLCRSVEEKCKQKFYSYFSNDCFCHLAKVTAGLDSAIIGETEIQGQVKAAYETAAGRQALSPQLHYLFQKSLAIGKDVRSKLLFGRGQPKLEEGVLKAGKELAHGSILFVGASAINEKIWSLFHKKKAGRLFVCNRSKNLLTESFPGEFLSWDKLELWPEYDWVIFATNAPHHLINSAPKKARTKLIVDLSVPRNVDPKVGDHLKLLNIDQIQGSMQSNNQNIVYDIAEKLVIRKACTHTELFLDKMAKVAGL